MKRISYFLSIFVFLVATLSSCKKENKNEVEKFYDAAYNYFIVLDSATMDLSNMIYDTVSVEDLEAKLDEINKLIDKNSSEIAKLKDVQNDPGLKQTLVTYYKEVKVIVNGDYAKAVNILVTKGTNLTDDDIALVDSLTQSADNQMDNLYEKFYMELDKFADAHNLPYKE